MKTYPSTQANKGFTLIELLTVIAIIGILAAIIIPAVGNVRIKAAQAASASDLKQIALAYNNFAISGARSRTIRNDGGTYNATSPAQWAQILAQYAELNDGSLYFIASADDVAGRSIPKVILDVDDAPTGSFEADVNSYGSYAMAVNVSPNAQSSITPLIWTKGIATTSWDQDKSVSPWGDDGGHIAFLDGHVSFYPDLGPSPANGELVSTTGTPTNDITAAVPASVEPSGS